MAISLKRAKNGVRMSIGDRANVRVCEEVREALLDSLTARTSVVVDLSKSASADAAFSQLLASAQTSFSEASTHLEVVDPNSILASVFPGCRP